MIVLAKDLVPRAYVSSFVQYWKDRHARLAQFVSHALEDLPKLLEEAYDMIFPHDTPWVVFHFVSVCRVLFERFPQTML